MSEKQRWTERAVRYEQMAAKARAEADRLQDRRDHENDMAFLTQPGVLPGRAQMRRRLDRAFELSKKADAYADKAANLRAMASRNKGDAERGRELQRAAMVNVGDLTDSIWGRRRVAKVNVKTVRLEGVSCPVDRAHVRVVEAADAMA